MTMDVEKLRRMAKPMSDNDAANAASRRQNRLWLALSANIAISIRYALRKKDMSQTDLANLLETSPQNVAKMLSGKQNFTIQNICRIEQLLGISLINATSLKNVVPDNEDVILYTISVCDKSGDNQTFTSTSIDAA